MKWLWNDDNSSVIDRFVFATKDGALTATIPDRSSTSTKVSLFAAGGSNDNITGSRDNDFIFGGNGDDTLRGGLGDDLLAGGAGDDRLNGGGGRNFLTGGAGNDTVFYEATGDNGVRLTATGITDIENMGWFKDPATDHRVGRAGRPRGGGEGRTDQQAGHPHRRSQCVAS